MQKTTQATLRHGRAWNTSNHERRPTVPNILVCIFVQYMQFEKPAFCCRAVCMRGTNFLNKLQFSNNLRLFRHIQSQQNRPKSGTTSLQLHNTNTIKTSELRYRGRIEFRDSKFRPLKHTFCAEKKLYAGCHMVHLQWLRHNSLLKYASQLKIAKNALKPGYFWISRSFKVTDVGTSAKLVSSACCDK